MRKFFRQTMILAAMFLAAATANAQAKGFSYQAVVRNAQGELVTNSRVGVRIMLTNATGEHMLYCETHTTTTNGYGVL